MRRIALLLVFFFACVWGYAQTTRPDLDNYYYYPFSFGAGYRQVTPLGDFAAGFAVHEFAGTVRVPLPTGPLWHAVGKVGLIRYDSQDETQPRKWDHRHVYFAPGMGLSHRLSKEFEIGADLALGLTQSVYPYALDQPVGAINFLAAAEAKLTLNPSFNVSIDINPALRFIRSFSPFHDYDGFSFGFGIAGHYRLGRDPDSAESLIRAIRFGEIELPDAFSAMQSYYVDNPIGRVTITNTERYPVEDLQVAFYQNGFMDSPTPSERMPVLEPGESATVELHASFNEEVFTREGVTPLTGEIITTYTARGRPGEQRQSVTYDLHDKTALTWDDDRKVAAFVTPADSALRNYASFVRRVGSEATLAGLSDKLEIAIQLYNGLAELDIIYQEDPTSPFTEVQQNDFMVDSISLPRDTLTRATGDCDDLTVLYVSLLETLGVETGYITVPGHIYAAFNTGVMSRDYRQLHPNREMVIDIDGQAWIPVEVTLIGRDHFMSAWQTGVRLWTQAAGDSAARNLVLTGEAQDTYRAVGLRERDLGLQYGDEGEIRAAFVEDRDRLANTILESYQQEAEERDTARAWNSYGIAAAQLDRLTIATTAFRRATYRDSGSLTPRINLGSVYYLRGNYTQALGSFQEAERILRDRGRDTGSSVLASVLINISKTYYVLGNYDRAETYFAQASEQDPNQAAEHSYLASVDADSTTGRASDAGSAPEILFVDEQEE
jgi:hypothetical protein